MCESHTGKRSLNVLYAELTLINVVAFECTRGCWIVLSVLLYKTFLDSWLRSSQASLRSETVDSTVFSIGITSSFSRVLLLAYAKIVWGLLFLPLKDFSQTYI